MSATPRETVTLDIVSDVVCPWCYVGKARLAEAMHALDPGIELQVRWQPYELNPGLPAEGMARREYCERKFGSLERANALYARVAAAAAENGLTLAVERIARTPNTRAAHVLLALAEEHGCQDALVDALFAAYFVDGRDIGARTELLAIAESAGLATALAVAALDDPARAADVEAREQTAADQGVSGVPSFMVNGRLLFSGAQDPETIARALERAVARGLHR